MAYPLGWSVIPQIVVRKERWPGLYGRKGIPLVSLGQELAPDQPIMRMEQGRDALHAGGSVDALSTPPSARVSPTDVPGTSLEDYSESIPAGLYGHVAGFTRRGGVIIESRVAQVQGMIGAGPQVVGVLTLWRPPGPGQKAQVIPPGAILVVPEPLTFALLHQAMHSGVTGIVTGSVALRDLEGFLRTDVLQLLTAANVELAQAHLPPPTLLCTEGVGTFSMPAYILNLLREHEGSIALLSGTTSVRHSISPSLLISFSPAEMQEGEWRPLRPDPTLFLGVQVRVCGGEYEGVIGLIDYFFIHEQIFRAGIRARAARLRLGDGTSCVVPLTLIERIR
ncbi:MAG: hypothetical protein NVS2B12_13970 [Ktedonobacteraceae bacterium]